MCGGTSDHSAHAGKTTQVYPRVCGGTSSRQWRPHHEGLEQGSIPACAGEPSTLNESVARFRPKGLSPRVRGNRVEHVVCLALREGSIPACAGEPAAGDAGECTRAARSIPACAGEPLHRPTWTMAIGQDARSIPACAGEPCAETVAPCHVQGSIPACAGEPASKTYPAHRPSIVAGEPVLCAYADPVYPRVCGGTSMSRILCLPC